jgi:hypothetical protein
VGEDRLVVWIRLFVGMFLVSSLLTLKVVAQQDRQNKIPDSFHIRDLSPVLIKLRSPVAGRKDDTVMYDAARYRTAATFRLSALLNQIPGFSVDENGRIHYNGKEISRVMIDGDDLIGEQYGLLTNRLKSALIRQVQVIEKHQPKKILQGVQASDQLAVNLVINPKDRNKPGVTLNPSWGNKKHQVNGDLYMIRKELKSLLFASSGNINLTQQYATKFSDEFNLWKDYTVFNIPRVNIAVHDFLPPVYQFYNRDKSAEMMMSLSLDTSSRLKIILQSLSRQIKVHESEEHIYFPANNFRFQRDTKNDMGSNGFQGKLLFERDPKGKYSSTFQLIFKFKKHQMLMQQKRTGYLTQSDDLHGDESQVLIQSGHEAYFKLNHGVLKLESGYGIDKLRDDMLLTGASLFQDFSHFKQTARTHLSWIRKPQKFQLMSGFIVIGEHNYSDIRSVTIQSAYIKYYPYLNLTYQFNKRWRQSIQAAAGGAHTRVAGNSGSYGIYHASVRTEWQHKPTFHYFFTVQATQKIQEGQAIWAGPFYITSVTKLYAPDRYAVPRVLQSQLGIVKMNLYTGLMLNAFAQVSQSSFEQGLQLAVRETFEILSAFQVPRQLKITGQINLEKYVHAVKIKYNFSGSLNRIRQPQRVNELNFDTRLNYMLIENRLGTHWKKAINLTSFYAITISRNVSSSGIKPTVMKMHRTGMQLNYRIRQRGVIQIRYGYDRSRFSGFFHALDGMGEVSVKDRWKLSLHASNLLNIRYYSIVNVAERGTTVYRRQLTGRTVMFGLQYTF